MAADTLARVCRIIHAHLAPVATVAPGARLVADLKADSLDLVELTMALEDEFDVELPDDDAEKVVTIADAVALVDRMLAAKSAAKVADRAGDGNASSPLTAPEAEAVATGPSPASPLCPFTEDQFPLAAEPACGGNQDTGAGGHGALICDNTGTVLFEAHYDSDDDAVIRDKQAAFIVEVLNRHAKAGGA